MIILTLLVLEEDLELSVDPDEDTEWARESVDLKPFPDNDPPCREREMADGW